MYRPDTGAILDSRGYVLIVEPMPTGTGYQLSTLSDGTVDITYWSHPTDTQPTPEVVDGWGVQYAYDLRIADLEQLAAQVRDQGATVTLPSNGSHDCRSTETAFRLYSAANSQAALPGATQTSDVDVWGLWYRWAISDVPSIMVQLYLLFAAANGVAESHQDDLEVLLAAGDEQGIRVYDITTGWPAPPEPPAGQSALDIGTTETVPLGSLAYVLTWDRTRDDDREPKRIMRFLHRIRPLIGRRREVEREWLIETGQA